MSLPVPLTSLLPMPGALINIILARSTFDYPRLRAQWSSRCLVYLLFGHATTRLCRHCAGERVFPLESGRVYYMPPSVFVRETLGFALVTTRSLTLLPTVLNRVTFGGS